MSSPTSALPEPQFLTIPSKLSAPISHTFIPSTTSTPSSQNRLILFLNGLGLPASSWLPTVSILHIQPHPAIFTYDRFAQGLTTSHDPLDTTPGKEKGHDFLDAANDLYEILGAVKSLYLKERGGELEVLMIGASIGVNILRLFAHKYQDLKMVRGAIFLDSNIANMNYSDFLPDPTLPSFKPEEVVAEDCTLVQYIRAYNFLTNTFDLSTPNKEHLDRSTSAILLPTPSLPMMKGVEITVVGHDPERFADVSLEGMGIPKSVSERWVRPVWEGYNEGLIGVGEEGRGKGVVIAKGCAHFIQCDDAGFVAREVKEMMERLGW